MFYFNTLNLNQVSGGNQVKQGDFGSTFTYKLADEKNQELDIFDQKTAYVNLVLNNNIVFTTTVIVDGSTVTFNIDKAIPTGLYFLEIKIDSYIFPSDRQTIILVTAGAVAYDLKDLVPNYDTNMTIAGILSDLSQKGIDITDLKSKMNVIYNNALADHAEIIQARGGLPSLDARLDGLDLKDTDLQNQINTNKTSITTTGLRIDNLIANAGNGTVPSELIDMRVGADRVVYRTAGEAVREQFKNVLAELEEEILGRKTVSYSEMLANFGKSSKVFANEEIMYDILADDVAMSNPLTATYAFLWLRDNKKNIAEYFKLGTVIGVYNENDNHLYTFMLYDITQDHCDFVCVSDGIYEEGVTSAYVHVLGVTTYETNAYLSGTSSWYERWATKTNSQDLNLTDYWRGLRKEEGFFGGVESEIKKYMKEFQAGYKIITINYDDAIKAKFASPSLLKKALTVSSFAYDKAINLGLTNNTLSPNKLGGCRLIENISISDITVPTDTSDFRGFLTSGGDTILSLAQNKTYRLGRLSNPAYQLFKIRL